MKMDESDIHSIQVRLEQNEDLSMIVASGPYMINGSLNTTSLDSLIEAVKTQNVHLLVLVIFIDAKIWFCFSWVYLNCFCLILARTISW